MFAFTKKVNSGVLKLISTIYFIQGFVGISGVALPLYLRSSGLSVQQIAAFMSVSTFPWFLKIFYGAISDVFPIWGYRRKPYLVIYCFLMILGWVLMSILPVKMTMLVFAMMIANLGFAAIDVVTDGIVVEHSDEKTAQIYQSISWGMRSVGALISGILGGYLAGKFDHRLIFLWTAFLPIVSLLALTFYHEKKTTAAPTANFLIPLARCGKFLFSGDLLWFSAFLLIASSSAALSTPLFFYMRETLGFHEQFLGVLSSATWGGAIAGCFIYLKFLKQMKLGRALGMAIIIGFLAILSCILIHDKMSAIIIFILCGILGYISILPLVSSAAKLANATGVESSLFAVLMSIQNLGAAIFIFLGGFLFELIGLHLMIILIAFVTLSGLLVVQRLRSI